MKQETASSTSASHELFRFVHSNHMLCAALSHQLTRLNYNQKNGKSGKQTQKTKA